MPLITQPLKTHGGKHYMAKHIHSFAPKGGYSHRVIPCAGGLGEFWNWDAEGISEVVNDIDNKLTNFYRVLRDESFFNSFKRSMEATPFSQTEWNSAHQSIKEPCVCVYTSEVCLQCAQHFFINVRQSLAGRGRAFSPLSKTRTRRGMNEQASAWWNVVEGLAAVHERLRRVVILNRDICSVLKSEDGLSTFFYIDPPYPHSTRSAKQVYEFEMSDEKHHKIINTVLSCKAKFMISGYRHPIYDVLHEKHGWKLKEINLPNSAAGGNSKRIMTECLWMNY